MWWLSLILFTAIFAWLVMRAQRKHKPLGRSERPETSELHAPAKRSWHLIIPDEPLLVYSLELDAVGDVLTPSASQPGTNWVVNLRLRSCTCPDFAKRRAQLHRNDVRRFCKHAVAVLNQRDLLQVLPPLPRALLTERHFPGYDIVHAETIDGMQTAIAHARGSDWVNLFAPALSAVDRQGMASDAVPYGQFGYDLRARRWAWGATPRWIRGASKRLRELFVRGF